MDSSHTGKPVGHIPLLWLALPVLGGVVVAEGISGPGDSLIPLLLISGLLGSLLALVASIGQSRLTSLTWKLCFPVAAFLLAWAYAQWRSGPASAPGPDIAAREVVIQVRIERRPRLLPSGNAFTTTARAVEPPAHLAYLEGESLPLFVWLGETDNIPDRKSMVLLRGELRTVASMEESPYRDYLLREGYRFQLSRGQILETTQAAPFPHNWLQRTCRFFERALYHGADNESKRAYAGIAAAMMLGNRASLAPEQRVLFARSGTMHLFAISGLHVGILALVLGTLFSLCRVPRRWVPLFALPVLGLYVAITGASPSAVRAWVMVSLFWLGYTGRRQAHAHGTLACSLILVLLISPSQVKYAGFQLSYSVVFAILFYGLPLGRYWQDRWQPFRHLPEGDWTMQQRVLTRALYWTAGGLAISVSATLASLPWTLAYFQLASLIGILLNTVFAPITLLVISSGSLSLLFSLVSLPWLSSLFNHACWMILALMEKLIDLALQLPFAWQQLDFRHPLMPYFCEMGLLILMAWVGCRRTPSAWHLAVPPLFLIVVLVIGTQSVT